MVTSVPRLPSGVRPVVGDHLAPIALGRFERELRAAVNLATVARLRARRRPVELRDPPPYPKLFVVGCARSGTSWVQGIFSAHPDIVASSESHAYETIYEPVVARGRTSVAAWTKVLQRHDISEREARWVGLHWWLNRASLLGLVEWALTAEGVDAADAAERVIQGVFDSYFLEMGGDPQHTLLEKTPGHLRYADRILRRFPEARVVEVLRDGRDVCVSLQMQALTARWPPTSRRDQIGMWVRAVRRGIDLRADPACAGRLHTLRYEELKAEPAAEIARLLEFAELEATPAVVAEIAEATDFRHRRVTGPGKHNRQGQVGDWRNHFTAADEALFHELAGDVFEAVGYRF